MSAFIQNQNWRYATKKFDATKKISTEDLDTLKEAIRLSSSSYGLQPYKVLIIENSTLREKLKPVAWGQNQITDASHLIVFANEINIGATQIDAYLAMVSETRGIALENLSGYGDFMKSKITPLPLEAKNTWTSKQTYLALANLLNAAAELKIDVTPMEGFETAAFNEILGLTEKGLSASVIAPIGYRHEEDDTQHYKKVRKSNDELFITL
jgi:nitroreductase